MMKGLSVKGSNSSGKFLHVEGALQNQDGVVNVRTSAVRALDLSAADVRSHDFH